MVIVNNLVKSSEAIPINEEAKIMCPVEDTGRYSVMPSMMASVTASRVFKMDWYCKC